MAGVREPLHSLTPTDRGPIVIVVGYSLLSTLALITISRFHLAAIRKIGFGYDDFTYCIASVFAVLATVILHLARNVGLGRHLSTLDSDEVNTCFKLLYAVQFLSVASITCSKLSSALLFERIITQSNRSKIIIFVSIAVLTVYSLFAVAFQCSLPRPWIWTHSNCSTKGRSLYLVIVFNILIDVLLSGWLVPTFYKLQMRWKNKLWAIALFGCRVCMCIPFSVQLAFLRPIFNAEDQTWDYVIIVVLQQVTVYFSIIFSTIPRTNQFLFNLGHGSSTMLRVPDDQLDNATAPSSRQQSADADSKKEPKSLKLVPYYDTVLSNAVSSSNPSAQNNTRRWRQLSRYTPGDGAGRKTSDSQRDRSVYRSCEIKVEVNDRD